MKTIEEIISYLEHQPDNTWIVDRRGDKLGRHCVLGHLDKVGIHDSTLKNLNIAPTKLIRVNDGVPLSGGLFDTLRKTGVATDGASIKKRVLAYLKSL